MSYISCGNSALIAPSSYPFGAVGSVVVPTLLTGVATASLAVADAFNAIVLPKGVWMMSGTLEVEGATGNVLSSSVQCLLNGATNQGQLISNYPTNTNQGIPICYTLVSDGNDAVSLAVSCATSAGTWSIQAGASSLLKLVKVA